MIAIQAPVNIIAPPWMWLPFNHREYDCAPVNMIAVQAPVNIIAIQTPVNMIAIQALGNMIAIQAPVNMTAPP